MRRILRPSKFWMILTLVPSSGRMVKPTELMDPEQCQSDSVYLLHPFQTYNSAPDAVGQVEAAR